MHFDNNELLLTTNTTHDMTIFNVDEFLNENLDKYDYINLNTLLSVKYWYTGTTYHAVNKDTFKMLVGGSVDKVLVFILDDDEITRNELSLSSLKSVPLDSSRSSTVVKVLTKDFLGIDENTDKVVLLLVDTQNSVRGSTPYCKFHLISFTEDDSED